MVLYKRRSDDVMRMFLRGFSPLFSFLSFFIQNHLKKKNLAVGRANFENNNKLLRRIF